MQLQTPGCVKDLLVGMCILTRSIETFPPALGLVTPLKFATQQIMRPDTYWWSAGESGKLLLDEGADPNRCVEHHSGCRPWICDNDPIP